MPYGMIRLEAGRSTGSPDFGLRFGNPDFVAYAKAYGCEGDRG